MNLGTTPSATSANPVFESLQCEEQVAFAQFADFIQSIAFPKQGA